MLKHKFLCKTLVVSLILVSWICFHPIQSSAANESQFSSQSLPNFEKLIIGEWKLVDRIMVDEEGNKTESLDLFESFSADKSTKNEDPKKKYEGRGLTFNTAGEAFDHLIELGTPYQIKDSTLTMGGAWKILVLDNKTLKIQDVTEPDELMDLGFGNDLLTYERVNSDDRPSASPELRKLILGEWESFELQNVTVEGNALYMEKERVVEMLKSSKDKIVEFKVTEKQLSFGRKQMGTAPFFNYQIADSMIYIDGNVAFQILKLSTDSLSVLGPFDPSQQRILLNLVRKRP